MKRRRIVGMLVVMMWLARPLGATADGHCWQPPVDAAVSDPYRAPECRWCAGNRGIEFNTVPGQRVRAVAAGHVSFVGAVAGIRYVVVRHPDGRRSTYGNILVTNLAVGDPVVAAMVVGTTAGRFHFGLRDGDVYVDPTPLMGRWVSRARLVPVDGSPPRPSPPPQLVCDSVSSPLRRR